MKNRKKLIDQVVVTANQMREIENRILAGGMPIAALMEKVSGLIARWIIQYISNFKQIGILVGPGHNGGDALVVARELYFRGYEVKVYSPFNKYKDLTAQHFQYVKSLGISCYSDIQEFSGCDIFLDGIFGFGLKTDIQNPIASVISTINQWFIPVISIDIPSGLHTDTGEVLGTAIRARYTLCLGLWKLGLLQEQALDYVGRTELIDFDIPEVDIQAVLGKMPEIQRITFPKALSILGSSGGIPSKCPSFSLFSRSLITHKYKEGSLLLICGSQRYAGAAILTALGARASGVGMLSIAVPESLKFLLISHLPEAIVIGCPETNTGVITKLVLPNNMDINKFDAIACGPGLTTEVNSVIYQVLESKIPLLMDADALNILAKILGLSLLINRQAPSILTPHLGEFRRLFINISEDRIASVQTAAKETGAIILLKGARTVISNSKGKTWVNPESTSALARGGSGDILTGLLGGLITKVAYYNISLEDMVTTAVWWHSQAAILAANERTELGVDGITLANYLTQVICK
ncbi:YjeF protein, function unknown [Richelia intracellularis HH01]|uniref:Bifunctional NAD(P)H-hydrate repair enzyme n=1 Tax=Richelia intracellularis HH01 TaxID=1165094 RepID=M1X317_9NOST|nr:bifunctional ADP-dependent NAD(P)H-hydrate dehydratase/NAD(P)H-hydrate epimerase [Richelia intracellularis]CCH67795.1 YjeF protein, function unknown [Richelia intracellularis HH01]